MAAAIFATTLFRRLQKIAISRSLNQRHAEHDGFCLFHREHERRQVKAGAQDIADAAFSGDRHPHGLQRDDVAIDRADGDLQLRSVSAAVTGVRATLRIWMISNSLEALRIGPALHS